MNTHSKANVELMSGVIKSFRSNFRKMEIKVKQSLYTPWRRLGGEEV
jgi:hypothetical protein